MGSGKTVYLQQFVEQQSKSIQAIFIRQREQITLKPTIKQNEGGLHQQFNRLKMTSVWFTVW